MTTKARILPYQHCTDIDYSKLEFNPDEPDPLSMYQDTVLQECMQILAVHIGVLGLGFNTSNFLSSNTFICYDRRNLNVRVAPDCYIAFGVDTASIRRRRLYLPWEVGKAPDFALEIASDTTKDNDVSAKRRIYAQIGIPEYWRFDPTGEEYYGEHLAGEVLLEGVYRPIPLTTAPDGLLKGYSSILNLSLTAFEERLLFYDPDTGSYLRNLRDEQTAHQSTLEALQSERASRESDQLLIRELQERLRRLTAED